MNKSERTVYFNPRAPRGARPAYRRVPQGNCKGFQSTRPARGATVRVQHAYLINEFQSTRPARGATKRKFQFRGRITHFNPRAPRGARRCTFEGKTYTAYISIHAPREGRDGNSSFRVVGFREISIHAPREGRDVLRLLALRAEVISIHAPREGRDVSDSGTPSTGVNFNPRAPRGARPELVLCGGDGGRNFNPRAPRGARPQNLKHSRIVYPFQSTRPARGATRTAPYLRVSMINFNPRAPRGARPILPVMSTFCRIFQSTRPARGATDVERQPRLNAVISIHAPREGRDMMALPLSRRANISIHAPREGRDHEVQNMKYFARHFNPRAPRGARRVRAASDVGWSRISIHAPREGRDLRRYNQSIYSDYFNPRAPRGARHATLFAHLMAYKFQSTRPARGATEGDRHAKNQSEISIHAPREGRD